MDSSIIVPITLWNNSEPTFRISSICMTPNNEKLTTGSYNGQLCIWDLNIKNGEITPKNILIGHKYSVTCLVSTNEFVISGCEGGRLCRWNLEDGYCDKTNNSSFVHRNLQLFNCSNSNEELLFACGDYSEIYIIHPFTLQVIHILNSKVESDWISSFHVIPSQNNKSDVVSGITINGCAKLWVVDDLLNDNQCEVHSNSLPVIDVVDLKYNLSRTEMLVVCLRDWIVFDSELSNTICKSESYNGERLLGGNFYDLNVVVWTNAGKFYIYKIINGNYELVSTILDDHMKISLFDPAMNIFQSAENEKYFVLGESSGKINIWKMDSRKSKSLLLLSTSLKDKWIKTDNGFFNNFVKYSNVTCCIYVLELDRFFVGCFDGTIISFNATQGLTSFYFQSSIASLSNEILSGHEGKVNCLLYPYEKYSHFKKSHLISGGSDFSVCLWDVNTWELLHRFCVQSGEILKLIIPPQDCSSRVKHSICSVSSDHSVAVLNLKDHRCIILTSRHEFPVVSVNWKPLDDFIVIECFDGTVYVWQMDTGHLDRVLSGVIAQEVLFACNEKNTTDSSLYNFCINETFPNKNSMQRQVFQLQESTDINEYPFSCSGFLVSENSESHIFMCNVEYLITKFTSALEKNIDELNGAINHKITLLTQALSLDLQKKSSSLLDKIKETGNFRDKCQRNDKTGLNVAKHKLEKDHQNYPLILTETILNLVQLYLSSLHIWGLSPSLDELLSSELGLQKPVKTLPFGIYCHPGVYSLFLSAGQKTSSSLTSSTCISIMAFSKILESLCLSNTILDQEMLKSGKEDLWRKLYSFYDQFCSNSNNNCKIPRPKIEILARAWQTKCLILRSIVQKLLGNYLQTLGNKETVDLLDSWYKYLPHFKILDKTSSESFDFENCDLKTVALVLFGIVGSDLKFKANDHACQENYVYQTCASFVYLILLPKDVNNGFSSLQTIAVDFIGRGYIVWEPFLRMEKIFSVLFQMCTDSSKLGYECSDTLTALIDKSITSHNALKSIAIARTAAFINCLMKEINLLRSSTNKTEFLVENSKPEILSILVFLLEKTPYIMLLYLNDVISIFIYCIDLTHLKQENITDLIPVLKKFRQIHHSVSSQRIAVGLGTGSVILHDLKAGKMHSVSAHKDSVSAVKFSEDGKLLASYSCYENRISFWQVLTGIFGLGHMHVKCIKSCSTFQIHDEEIRNHFEIAQLTWIDNKSVELSLCDGSQTVFHC